MRRRPSLGTETHWDNTLVWLRAHHLPHNAGNRAKSDPTARRNVAKRGAGPPLWKTHLPKNPSRRRLLHLGWAEDRSDRTSHAVSARVFQPFSQAVVSGLPDARE